MGEFFDGFITGFADTLATGINDRNKIAQDYFQKQYEIATTVGLQNHRKVEQQVEGSVKLAKQLQQMGVPRNIIMAVASQDPQGLGDFYDMVAGAQQNGVVLDEAFFNDFVTVSKDFQAPDESFESFFGKAFRPVARAAAENPEGFQQDRKGGIFAAMVGADPYGRARRQLDETIVVDGLSASDLLQYGENYQAPGVENGATVTFDYSKTKASKEGALSVAEIKSLDEQIESTIERIVVEKNVSREEAREAAINELLETYKDHPEAREHLTERLGGSSGITTEEIPDPGPLDDLGITEPGGQEQTTPVPAEPDVAVEPPPPQAAPPKPSALAPVGDVLDPGNAEGVSGFAGNALRTATMGPVGVLAGTAAWLYDEGQKVSADPIDIQAEPELARLEVDGVIYEFKGNDEDGNAVYTNLVTGQDIPINPALIREAASE